MKSSEGALGRLCRPCGDGAHGEDDPAQWTDCPRSFHGARSPGTLSLGCWARNTQGTSHTIAVAREAGSLGGLTALPGAGEAETAWTCTLALPGPPPPRGLGQASSAFHASVSTLKLASFLRSLTYQEVLFGGLPPDWCLDTTSL